MCVCEREHAAHMSAAVIGQFCKSPHDVYWQHFETFLPIFFVISYSHNIPALRQQPGERVVVIKKHFIKGPIIRYFIGTVKEMTACHESVFVQSALTNIQLMFSYPEQLSINSGRTPASSRTLHGFECRYRNEIRSYSDHRRLI